MALGERRQLVGDAPRLGGLSAAQVASRAVGRIVSAAMPAAVVMSMVTGLASGLLPGGRAGRDQAVIAQARRDRGTPAEA
jgi:hypothetical protein